jgi:uncharacterized surface protein with fasciclin (FAS1) repeats
VVAAEKQTLYELLGQDERFSTFLSYIKDQKLDHLLKDARKGTVFVPVNDAFDEKSTFFKGTTYSKELLKYHLINDTFYTASFEDGKLLTTESEVDGHLQRVKITSNVKNYFIGDAKLTDKDLKATNGVVHAIDKILTPPVNLGKFLKKKKSA